MANPDVDGVAMGGTIGGNVITGLGGAPGGADVLGADSAQITSVSFQGTPGVFSGGVWTVVTPQGTLTMAPNGSYSYTSNLSDVAVSGANKANWTNAIGVYGFDESSPLTGGNLNLAAIGAMSNGANVTARNNAANDIGIGVETGGTDTDKGARIQAGESLVMDLKVNTDSATVSLTRLDQGDSASWSAFDQNGILLASGTISGENDQIVSASIVAAGMRYIVFGEVDRSYLISGISFAPTVVSEVFSYTLTDADGSSSSSTLTIQDNAQPDAPVNILPTAQITLEDTDLILGSATGNAITVDDADGDTLTTTLTIANGTLTALSFAGATITGNGTGSVTISGTAAAINGALNGATFKPADDFSGTAQIAVGTSDGSLTDSDTLSITVVPVADTPTLSFGALVYTATSITSANATTTTNGFNMLAYNPNGSAGAISLRTGVQRIRCGRGCIWRLLLSLATLPAQAPPRDWWSILTTPFRRSMCRLRGLPLAKDIRCSS